MRYFDEDEAKELNAPKWMLDLLDMNPPYCSWGPGEDYMPSPNGKGGWASSLEYGNWTEQDWEPNDLNEIVNFYFSIHRPHKECVACGSSGYAPKAKALSESFHSGWSTQLTEVEVRALHKSGRLYGVADDEPTPMPEKINAYYEKERLGHDAINRCICVRARCEAQGLPIHCPECDGNGYIYTSDTPKLSLTLWILHPRKGAARGVVYTDIQQSELPAVFKTLQKAAKRNADRFGKIPSGE